MSREFWTTKEGNKIRWCDLTDDHLHNLINMLAKNNHPALLYAQKEEYSREVVELLKNNPEKRAWWLISSNKQMRSLAERVKQ